MTPLLRCGGLYLCCLISVIHPVTVLISTEPSLHFKCFLAEWEQEGAICEFVFPTPALPFLICLIIPSFLPLSTWENPPLLQIGITSSCLPLIGSPFSHHPSVALSFLPRSFLHFLFSSFPSSLPHLPSYRILLLSVFFPLSPFLPRSLPGQTDGVLRWGRRTEGEGLPLPAPDIGPNSGRGNDRC